MKRPNCPKCKKKLIFEEKILGTYHSYKLICFHCDFSTYSYESMKRLLFAFKLTNWKARLANDK